MAGSTRNRRWAVLVVAMAATLAACTSSGTATTTTSPATTTSTITTTTTPDDPDVSGDVVTRLRGEIADLVDATEELRGLTFIDEPDVTILGSDAFAARVRADLEEELDAEGLGIDSRVFRLLGILDPGVDLQQLYLDLYTEQVAGFYDGETGELVVGGDHEDLSVADRTTVVHELVHALGDQHFDFSDQLDSLVEEERFDESSALQALVEGDATYFQYVYIQDLPLTDQLQMAMEAMDIDTSVLATAPDWVVSSLLFPYDAGESFVEQLVAGGGIAAVDAAYAAPPTTTENILHPDRYLAGETIRPVPPLDLSVDGYTTHEASTFGEFGFRLLLMDTVAPGVLTQAVDGWGGDAYEVISNDDDVAFAVAYRGDSDDDAVELTQALIEHARTVMHAGEGVDSGGGLLFDEGNDYVYLNRIGDGLVFVAATDSTLGAAVRSQMIVP
jgi:hypothetical protein